MDQSELNFVNEISEKLSEGAARSVFGHQAAVKLILGAQLIGGHVLIEGPPGIAKTLLARTYAHVMGLSFKRIQFTPDLMPSDITGVAVFEPKAASFRFNPGPIFADIVLADEINRTPPKTQAALLEAMEDRQVTVDGQKHLLSELFLVIATQNPIEHEGTFPLPEAQLDRFLFKIKLSYPSTVEEQNMLTERSKFPLTMKLGEDYNQIATIRPDQLLSARKVFTEVVVAGTITEYVLNIIKATREHPSLILGASPRAGLSLSLAAKFMAILSGRDYVVPDDVKSIIFPVLEHRLILQPQLFDSQITTSNILQEILNKIPPPAKLQ